MIHIPRNGISYVWLAPVFAVFLAGCFPSSPRFRSDNTERLRQQQEEDETRYAAKIREEVSREDDRKVDVKAATRKLRTNDGGALPPPGVNRDNFLLEVVSYLGVPYVYGGSSDKGMDCSGFSSTVYAHAVGKELPRTTTQQYEVGRGVRKNDLRFGDLVFFNTTGRNPSHVGVYIEDDLFAHASVSSGVTLSSLESTYYKKRYVGARRVLE
ncbi:MAG TPA: C40 family peptidase [Bacteroidota bacterium]|jgi:cell wall-associated NlpC family hydrolase